MQPPFESTVLAVNAGNISSSQVEGHGSSERFCIRAVGLFLAC